MDKLCKAKLRGSNELPSYSRDWQRGSLCCCGARPNLFHAAENPRNTSHIQPERVRITHGPERLGAASSTDLVCWRTLNLHISIVFIIFSRRATTLTQGPFVSVFFFLLCPSNPPHRPHTSTLPQQTHLASSSAEEYHCINGSLFCLCVRPFLLSALARTGHWLMQTCAALMKICVALFWKGQTASAHNSFCSSHIQREITLAWRNTCSQLKHFQIDGFCALVKV